MVLEKLWVSQNVSNFTGVAVSFFLAVMCVSQSRFFFNGVQPTIAHDETHEVGERICCPLWNCIETQGFPVKQKRPTTHLTMPQTGTIQ